MPTVLLGDYNNDLAVDLADYVVWRNTLGSTTALAADGDGDGLIDADDYIVWKSHFGETATEAAMAIESQQSVTTQQPSVALAQFGSVSPNSVNLPDDSPQSSASDSTSSSDVEVASGSGEFSLPVTVAPSPTDGHVSVGGPAVNGNATHEVDAELSALDDAFALTDCFFDLL